MTLQAANRWEEIQPFQLKRKLRRWPCTETSCQHLIPCTFTSLAHLAKAWTYAWKWTNSLYRCIILVSLCYTRSSSSEIHHVSCSHTLTRLYHCIHHFVHDFVHLRETRQKKVRLLNVDTVYEITKLMKESPGCNFAFQFAVRENVTSFTWNMKSQSPLNGQQAQTLFADSSGLCSSSGIVWGSLEFVKDAEISSRITGMSSNMKSFNFFFCNCYWCTSSLIYCTDNLSRILQGCYAFTAKGITNCCNDWRCSSWLEVMRVLSSFGVELFQHLTSVKRVIPTLPHRRKAPKPYQIGTREGCNPERVEDYYMYRCVYFEAFDLIINCIKNCTVQPGYYIYSRLESLFVNATNKLETEEDLDFVMKFYKEAAGKHQLEVQMDILAISHA